MSHSAALIILGACFVLAFLISAPFVYLARRRLKSKGLVSSRSIPRQELATLLAFVAVMFFGFAYAHIEPETWFGKLMATNTGRIAFLTVPALVLTVLRTLLRRSRPHGEPASK
jgi:hypothetical protein